MLNFAILDTKDFLSWVGGKAPLKATRGALSSIRRQLQSKFCAIIYSDQLGNSNFEKLLFVVDEKKMREFYAFVSTYISDYVPFTAYFRVISSNQLDLIEEAEAVRDDVDILRRIKPFVGVAIAEATLYLHMRGSGDTGKSLNLSAVNATYSSVALQGLLKSRTAEIGVIGRNWASLRASVGSDQLPLRLDKLEQFWEILKTSIYGLSSAQITPEAYTISSALRRALEIGYIGDELILHLLELVPALEGKVFKLRGPREERARAVQEAIMSISNNGREDGQTRDCVAGFLLSLLGDGSFKFLSSALSLAPALPMAPLWFAAWSAVQKSNDIMTENNCLGRRLARDLAATADLFSPPRDDVSIDELNTVGFEPESISRGFASSIAVEIYPNVSSRQGLSRSVSIAANSVSIQREIKELRQVLAHSSAIVSRMDHIIRADAEPDLFSGSATNSSTYRRK